MGSRKYPLLNDESWLRQKYIDEGLGTREMCVQAGAKTPNSVRQALIRFGIPVRSVREGLVINREDDHFILNRPVIDGCLLGDGFLRSYSRTGASAPYFEVTHKLRDHVAHMAHLLFSEGAEERVTEETCFNKAIGRDYTTYSMRTLSHDCLAPLQNEWYPESSGYRKVIPASIEVDETVLLHWFMDDGSSYRRKDGGRKKRQIVITLSSESFLREDQEMLCEKFNDRFDLGLLVHPYNQGTGWRIGVPQAKADQFYEIIGPCPVPSLEYKWK